MKHHRNLREENRKEEHEVAVSHGDFVLFMNDGNKSQGECISPMLLGAVLIRDINAGGACVVPTTKIIRKLEPCEVVEPEEFEEKEEPEEFEEEEELEDIEVLEALEACLYPSIH